MGFNIKSVTRRGILALSTAVISSVMLGQASIASAADLNEIKEQGTITFGIVTDQPPFGYINEKGENDGYNTDIMKLMAEELGVKPEYVTITSANRIPQLITGKVDMLVCVLGIYPDRAKVVQYVAPYASISAAIYGPADSAGTKLEELSGKSIGVEKASSMDKAVTDAAPKDANIQRFDDASSTVQALLSGQVDFIGSYDYQLATVFKEQPGKYAEKIVVSTEYDGIAVSPKSTELAKWTADFMKRHLADGSLSKIYEKHFGKPLPELPKTMEGINFTMN